MKKIFLSPRLSSLKQPILLLLFIGLALFLSPLLRRVFLFFQNRSAQAVVESFQQALESEEQKLLEQAKDLAAKKSIRDALRNRDTVNLTRITRTEAENRGIDGILVADDRGVVLSRLLEPKKHTNYIFNTTAWGRRLAEGKDISSIELGMANPFLMMGATPIKDGVEMLGAITASYVITDNLADRLKQKYLDPGIDLAFYFKNKGVAASTIADSKDNSALSSYISLYQDVLKNEDSLPVQPLHLNKRYFYLRHILIRESDGKPIGLALLLIPSLPATGAIIFATLLTALFFLANTLTRYKTASGEKTADIRTTALSLVLFIILFSLFQFNIKSASINVTPPTFKIYNSTMNFEPDYSIVTRNSEQAIDIIIAPGGEAINAATAVIEYDPLAVKIKEITTEKSFCNQDLFIEKNIDEKHGEVTVSCLVPNPGFSESKGIMAGLIIQPLRNGPFSFRFGKDTQVLANDGLGTNVLRRADNGSYQVADEQSSKSLIAFSPSHPNQERWYQEKTINFSWLTRPNRVYQYAFNHLPSFIPNTANSSTEHLATVRVNEDGIYYFHLLETGAGAPKMVAHHRVKIDATFPPPPIIRLSSNEVASGEIVRIELENQDTPTSIQPGLFIKINDGILLPVKSPLSIPFITPGKYNLTVRIFDKAGNYSETNAVVNVHK